MTELAQMTSLEKLDLSSNWLDGAPNIRGCKSLSRLKSLKSIALADIDFYDGKRILSCLNAIPFLKILDLSSSFWLKSPIPIQALASFHNLEVLDLSYNNFVGSIPSTIKLLSSLKVISFANNTLTGSLLPDHGLCELKNLQELDLSRNMLTGNLPKCLSTLSSLKLLDISSNQFTGMPDRPLIANLTALEYIDFSHNNFEGSFSFSAFSNLKNLTVVRFISDNGKFEMETEDPIGWIPLFQLKFLMLPNCNINRPKGSVFPSFLIHQNELRVLDLSHNSLKAHFPNWLINNNPMLEVLNLRNNSLSDTFSFPLYENANAWWIDISANHIIGTIPSSIQKFSPYIAHLNLSRNSLSGPIPSSVGDLNDLFALDLSDNELSGEVPKALFTNTSALTLLHLSNNKLYGEVFSGNLTIGRIQMLHLNDNYFTGKIGNVTSDLTLLDISNNLFTGIVPVWISNMEDSSQLLMNNNMLEGQFPCGTASFEFLDISHNFFSGPIPTCLNLQYVEHLHLGSNRFTGSIPNSFRNLTNVLTLDIGNNYLSGRIPKYFGELHNLRILLMRENNFSGHIPKQLCQPRVVSLLDLSSNSLSGSIPSCLKIVTGPSYIALVPSYWWSYPRDLFYRHASVLGKELSVHNDQEALGSLEEVHFTTKSMSRPYKGNVLEYMTGLDLSCNMLTGEIPKQIGLLNQIRTLNLSNNHLFGPIPVNFSNLASIESLDLSSNNLSGDVPSELLNLPFLAVFNVSYNNLSGKLPEMKGQFSTFTNASYEGNPLLCGPPLEKKCTSTTPPMGVPLAKEDNDEWYDIDTVWFAASLGSTWVVFLLGFAGVMYTNPHWRRMWFCFVEECMFTFYYFLIDLVSRPSVLLFRR
ncbi:putative non-specific serine/threonine protein kinase [Helianthus debilis subsp. tardiflorus]